MPGVDLAKFVAQTSLSGNPTIQPLQLATSGRDSSGLAFASRPRGGEMRSRFRCLGDGLARGSEIHFEIPPVLGMAQSSLPFTQCR